MQSRFQRILAALSARYLRAMTGKLDMRPAVSSVRDAQGRRLERLREIAELGIGEAAGMALMRRDAYRRMERGQANIDAVHLALFVRALNCPAEYVLTGGLDGYPDHVKRSLVELETQDKLVAEGRMAPPPAPVRRGRRPQKSNARTVSLGVQALEPEPAGPLAEPKRARVLRKVS